VDDSSSGDVDSDSGSGSGGAGAGGGDAGSGADSNSDESSAGDVDGDVATGDHASRPLESDGESESESESGSEGRGALPIARGFVFDDAFEGGVGSAKAEEDSESEVDNESDDAQMAGSDSRPKRSSREKRDKKRAKEDAEREIREREHALATRPDTPETAEDFERLLMGQPNASELWIRYMAFRVSLAQFEKARALAERALETVALPEELERVNIWIAYVNLEASCGTGESVASEEVSAAALRNRAAAVFRVFDRACQRVTDVKDLHLQVAAALRQSHPDIANEVLQRALKSFKSSTKVWCAVGAAQFSAGKVEGGRQTLERALLSLDKQKHVALIMKFAQLEYRHGSSERGRTVFSSLCANFPKRLDLWSVYLDMEVGRYRAAAKDGDAAEVEAALASVRMLFERCVTLDLSTKKTKFVFTRWLSFEVETGDKAAQSRVRSKARAYVETRLVPS
jgi:rRNA biogenesis protein RRP5